MLKQILTGEPVGETSFEERMAMSAMAEQPSQCRSCRHWNPDTMTTCKAFPKGIPLAILMGKFDHTYPWGVEYEDQGYRYEPLPDQDRPMFSV